mmetsp:Transcript_33207/g.80554  ORF Transcript_33207/g.80554 Transcript_33207/m.80554 type:complete len:264 (-) Transcript_33207:384-1175(-)
MNGKRPAVVTFNVGGTRIEVSRSMLEQYPQSMLARMASEDWEADPGTEMFIERDAVVFRHVLSYMRDKKVNLNFAGEVSKAGLLSELMYYGIDDVVEDSISTHLPPYSAPKYMAKITADHKSEREGFDRIIKDAQMQACASVIAHACCIRYMTIGSQNIVFSTTESKPNPNGYGSVQTHVARTPGNELDFDVMEALNTYGSMKYQDDFDCINSINTALRKYGFTMSQYTEQQGQVQSRVQSRVQNEAKNFFSYVSLTLSLIDE